MATIELTSENFEKVMAESKTIIIDFWAPWCAPCKSFGPIFEAASEQHSDVVFAKVNTESEQDLAGHFGIRSIPTTMVAREQIFLFQEAGALPAEAITEILGKVKELDMDEVRKSVAEQKEAS